MSDQTANAIFQAIGQACDKLDEVALAMGSNSSSISLEGFNSPVDPSKASGLFAITHFTEEIQTKTTTMPAVQKVEDGLNKQASQKVAQLS
jgi:hypothetical protein